MKTAISYISTIVLLIILAGAAHAQNRPLDGGIFKWNGQNWSQVEGAATRISVGPDGYPWVVNLEGNIYRWANGSFQLLPGRAKDIGIGADGTAWIIGWDNGIYKWNGSDTTGGIAGRLGRSIGSGWTRVPGAAVTISVQINGSPWVVNDAGEIYRWITDHFEQQAGRAREVAVEKSVWMIDLDGLVFKFNHGEWVPVTDSGIATRICMGPDSAPWIINGQNEIYHWVDGAFQRLPGKAMDIGVGADGSVWIVGPVTRQSSAGGTSIFGDARAANVKSARSFPQNGSELKFKYPPRFVSDTTSVSFEFTTTQPAISSIEISKRPFGPDEQTNRAYVVAQSSSETSSKETSHRCSLGNLKPGTHYYYLITIRDEAGKSLTEVGEFTTKVRID